LSNPPTTDTTRKMRSKQETTQKQDTSKMNLILSLKTKKEAASAKKYLVSAIKTIQQLICHHEEGKIFLWDTCARSKARLRYNSIHSVLTIKSLSIISRN
jgi:hypothetical protein